jgi:hypothetical protein
MSALESRTRGLLARFGLDGPAALRRLAAYGIALRAGALTAVAGAITAVTVAATGSAAA